MTGVRTGQRAGRDADPVSRRNRHSVTALRRIEVAVTHGRDVELAGDARREHPVEFFRASDFRIRRIDAHALVRGHQTGPRHADVRAREELHISGARHTHREEHRVSHARRRRVDARIERDVAHGAKIFRGTSVRRGLDCNDRDTVGLQLVALLAAEQARRRQPGAVDKLRRRNHETSGDQWKERATVDQRVEALRSAPSARGLRRRGQIIREHRLHFRRVERGITPQPVAHGLIEKYRDLIRRLLPHEHGLRRRCGAQIHGRAGVDAGARHDHRQSPTAHRAHGNRHRLRAHGGVAQPRLEWRNREAAHAIGREREAVLREQ